MLGVELPEALGVGLIVGESVGVGGVPVTVGVMVGVGAAQGPPRAQVSICQMLACRKPCAQKRTASRDTHRAVGVDSRLVKPEEEKGCLKEKRKTPPPGLCLKNQRII